MNHLQVGIHWKWDYDEWDGSLSPDGAYIQGKWEDFFQVYRAGHRSDLVGPFTAIMPLFKEIE